MTKDQAKRILLAFRPGSSDQQDPDVARALSMAESDPELKRWLEEQRVFQREMRAQLRSIAVPVELREQILRSRVIVPLWQRPAILAVAACLALALGLAALWTKPHPAELDQPSFDGFRSRMVSFAVRLYRMDIVTNDYTQVLEYLRHRGAPAEYPLAPALQSVPVKGGAKLDWQGYPVGMVCFHLQTNKTVYMFVVDDSAIRNGQLPGPAPEWAMVRGIPTASWRQGGKVYLVATDGSPAIIQRLVEERERQARLTPLRRFDGGAQSVSS